MIKDILPLSAVSPELGSSKPLIFQRILEIQQTKPDSDDFHEAKQRFEDDLVWLLEDAKSASSIDKLWIVYQVVPLISWGYDRNYLDDVAAKAREEHDKKISEAKREALASFLESVPNKDLSVDNIHNLLTLEESTKEPELIEIRRKVLSAVKEMSSDQAKDFFPRLRSQVTIVRQNGKRESEWVEVLSGWKPEEAKPYVDHLVAQIREELEKKERFMSDIYGGVITVIKNWSPEEQEVVVREVLIKYRLDRFWCASYFRMIKQWSPELAKPLLRDVLAKPVGSTYQLLNASSTYALLAIAMSNWPAEEVNAFLSEKNNTRWIREVVQAESQEASSSKFDYEGNYMHRLVAFKIATLEERDEYFGPKHSNWIEESFKTCNTHKAFSLVIKHPKLFSPEVARGVFILEQTKAEVLDNMFGIFSALSKDEQLAYQPVIVDLLMNSSSFYYAKLLPKMLDEISKKWTQEEIDVLVKELLDRGITNDVEKYCPNRTSGKTANIVNAFKLLGQRETITDYELIKKILEYSILDPSSSEGKAASALAGKIQKNQETKKLIVVAVSEAIITRLKNLTARSAVEVSTIATNYECDLSSYVEKLPVYAQSLIFSFGFTSIEQFLDLVYEHWEFVSALAKTPDVRAQITSEDIGSVCSAHVTLSEAEKLRRSGVDISQVKSEEDFKKMFDTLTKADETWGDAVSIGNPFKKGAEIFGYTRMFMYLDRRKVDEETREQTLVLTLTRHDALHSFEDIIKLYTASKMTPNQFWGNILNQVRMESKTYGDGNAHRHFNAVAASSNKDIESVINQARKYSDITRLQELASFLQSPQQVFASWENLKKYSDLEQMLGRTAILPELQRLKAEGKDKLYNYVETLAFHPDSKISMESVVQFWREPEVFIDANASHTPDEVQSRKKPSNYIVMPNLDLSAKELRDALVEGKMDSLQVFSALEIEYEIPLDKKFKKDPLKKTIQKALGSRKLGIEGASRSTKRLFSELQKVFNSYGLTIQAYLEGAELPEDAAEELFEDLIYDSEFGMSRPRVSSQKYVARINLKSDPEGVVAGNDTANCMPFGDGKTTVYTFNPNTAQFLLQIVREDGTRRTVAQSVLTKDADVKMSVPAVLEGLEQKENHIEQVLPENIVRNAQVYIACDNVEVAPNYEKSDGAALELIYEDFFREYLRRFGVMQNLSADKVVIGKGYADALMDLPEMSNTFIPQAPISYSDKIGDEVFVLDLTQTAIKNHFLQRVVRVVEAEKPSGELLKPLQGLEYLTFEDALKVAYLEGKAYSDNESLIKFVHNMENYLIAKDINNAAKNRPNMSLKYVDNSGKMRGYLLAYEGILNDEYAINTNEGYDFSSKPIIYIADLASDKESEIGSGRLINGFIDLYARNYLEKGNLIPLFLEAREQTSFRIIQRQLKKIGIKLGIEIELIELPTYSEGNDTMHPVIIQPRSQ